MKKLDTDQKSKKSQEEKNNQVSSSFIKEKLAGEIIENEGGDFYKREVHYDLARNHGFYQIGEIFEHKFSDLKVILNKKDKNIFKDKKMSDILNNFLFIDTETTGLMGGTGTLPFMIGAGYFKDNKFIVRQYFMRDYDDEYALLLDLKKLIKANDYLVSFNGKTFDLPLLETRFVLNRMNKPEADFHFDLLHISRRVWNHLPSCSLGSLENKILDIYRRDDVPGSEIPKIYFKYLRKKDPLLVAPIFKHNLIDIVSLVILLKHLLEVYNNTRNCQLSANELYNLGRHWEKKKELKKSIDFLEEAREKSQKYKLDEDIAKKLSWQYKREDNWEKAVLIWDEMVENKQGKLFPYRELAKYYEHQLKDYQKAKYYVQQALEILLEKRVIFSDFEEEKEKLDHRLNRLVKKMEKGV